MRMHIFLKNYCNFRKRWIHKNVNEIRISNNLTLEDLLCQTMAYVEHYKIKNENIICGLIE